MIGFCSITYRDYDTGELHTVDAWEAYGWVFEPGTDDALLSLPARKERFSYDWGNEEGVEIWADEDVKIQARQVTLPVFILADTLEQFWERYNAIMELLTNTSGHLSFAFNEIGLVFKLRYLSMTSLTKIGILKVNGLKGVSMRLTMIEDEPSIMLGGTPPPVSSDWILATGTWRNEGVWRDEGVWNF